MKKFILFNLILLMSGVMAACGGTGNKAQGNGGNESSDYPNESIRMVIPYGPGGASDVIFRIVGTAAGEELGTNVVPANIAGASSTTGSREVKGADPDGYTILASHDVIITAYQAGVVDYSYDAFEPVALLTQTPNMLAVHADTGWENMDDFVEFVKANPGEVKLGMTAGSTDHYFLVEMREKLGMSEGDFQLVNYEGTGEIQRAILTGEIHGGMTNYTAGQASFEEGTFVAIGVAHPERLEQLPDAPTMSEQGIDFVNATSRGIFAPEGTPEEVVNKLAEGFEQALNNPEVINEVENLGSITKYLGPDEYEEFMKELSSSLEKVYEDM